SSPEISRNDISVNGWDVYCWAPTKPQAALPTIRKNNIYNNVNYGVLNDNPGTGTIMGTTIDAKENWWGASDGPSGAGTGSGDKVSEGVDYSNWLASRVGVTPPVASFTYSLTLDIGNQTAQFTDMSTDDIGIASWYWIFGDGNTNIEQNPKHQYLVGNRSYTVILIVKDTDNNEARCTKEIFIALGGSDLDDDNIPDELDIDRDGDGVPNDKDVYPEDPSRWEKEVVKVAPQNLVPITVGIIVVVLIVAIALGLALRKRL
ncbi:MAG: PKD domain-containing protein, partial [Candidatus Thermoplasmatota archaeon]